MQIVMNNLNKVAFTQNIYYSTVISRSLRFSPGICFCETCYYRDTAARIPYSSFTLRIKAMLTFRMQH